MEGRGKEGIKEMRNKKKEGRKEANHEVRMKRNIYEMRNKNIRQERKRGKKEGK